MNTHTPSLPLSPSPPLSSPSFPTLSIIIVNWNTHDLLAQCLESVGVELAAWQGGRVETFVVDNASTDGSVALVRERFPWVRLIANTENVGFARANNQAVEQAQGRYILLLNSDAMLTPNSLTNLIAFADAHPQAGIIGVRLLNFDGSFQAAFNDFPTLLRVVMETWGLIQFIKRNPYYPSYAPHQSENATMCDWVGGACLCARRQAIEEVGVLDDSFFMNSEEVDWCFRMRQSGWQVWYTPAVEIVHLGGGSANRRSATQRMRLYEGKVRFLAKHHGHIAAWVARLNFRLSSSIKAIIYWILFLVRRRESDAVQSTSHWQVFVRRNWI